ncbi:hypothetical protein C0991_004474 [Blastosporella zonata]|nr:hypothetical protein C0991_004474 [Blastosporella zonata]
MSDEVLEAKIFATFEKYGEFLITQQSCLNLDLCENPSEEDDKKEYLLFKRLSGILDEYQEQSYLLDPYLENMVEPVVGCLRSHAKASVFNNRTGSPGRIERLATLLYSYVKCRGYKTITFRDEKAVRFFPHEIADLSIALDFLRLPQGLIQDPNQWALRYVVLIWLSLICMIPFDLSQFDEVGHKGHTATAIESSAKLFIGKAGLEREGAALLLSRLYTRQDTTKCFRLFLEWSQSHFETEGIDVISALGILQVICEVVKSGSAEQIQEVYTRLFAVSRTIDGSQILSNNTAVRKYRIKLMSRVAIRLLPGGLSFGRRKGRNLTGEDRGAGTIQQFDLEVPTEVEDVLEQLFNALQDKDTVVRWSAAKGIARISDRLPSDFSDQILETILGLFSIHSIAAASLYDLPAIAESTWHGACLACAELTRRGLVSEAGLPELIEWMLKALYFDLRKGAHSIGSNVRDAAAYAVWALARSQDPSKLSPFSESLSQRLTAVALYDREIHIRRAASAAFQEHVGRNSLFPHGIDVLGKTDFYAVSIRRNAFLMAAPQVAQHQEYRISLMNHILNVTLRHWDPSMRELGSQSLRAICIHDLNTLGTIAIEKSIHLLDSIDVSDLHGGLLALSEIAIAHCESGDQSPREARMREELNTSSPTIQQSLGILLGAVDYSTYNNALPEAVSCLLEFVRPSIPSKPNIEARRNCYTAMSRIITTVAADISRYLPAEIVVSLFESLLKGLDDYSTDQRGDVGSWIRVACIRSLTTAIEVLVRNARTITAFDTYLPPPLFYSALSGILKQGVERLDNVRQEAGQCFLRLCYLPFPDVQTAAKWQLPGSSLLKGLFGSGDTVNWNEASWLFPKVVRLLEITEYRPSILSGLVFSLGSKTDSTHRPLAASIVSYAKSLPVVNEHVGYDLNTLVNDLVTQAKSNLTSNANVIPVLQTFTVLLEGEALASLCGDPRGLESLRLLLNIVARNISRIKSVPRIHECMKINTAESIYVFLQGTDLGTDTDAVEEVLLETEWSVNLLLVSLIFDEKFNTMFQGFH